MTIKQLKRRVEFWVKRLPYLGLQHWDFEYVIEDSIEGHPNARAAVDTSDFYDNACITFDLTFVNEGPLELIDEVIIHELVHIAMRDFDELIDDTTDRLGDEGLQEFVVRQMTRERESLVERLARTIWVAYNE